jgi:DNA polymerase
MRWSILTPALSVHWDRARLTEGPGASRADAPAGDPVEAVWKSYYAAILNPARLKPGAMLKEMPKKYWKNMPETALVGGLWQAREARMVEKSDTQLGSNALAAWLRCGRRRAAAPAAPSSNARPRRCSAKARWRRP